VYSEKKIPDDGQRNCPEHVEFYSKNKFEKLAHLVGFVMRTGRDMFTIQLDCISRNKPLTTFTISDKSNTIHINEK